MGTAARKQLRGQLTYHDLWHTPDDGNRYEIIEGELCMTPPPYTVHQRVSRNLSWILHNYVTQHGLGEVLYAPVGVVLGKPNGVQPDVVFIAKERRDILREKAIFGAPDLVVEILSTSTSARDRGIKKDLFARSGVPYYWLVDPRKKTLLALRLRGAAYVVEAELSGNAVFRPALFPNLVIHLAEVWVAEEKK